MTEFAPDRPEFYAGALGDPHAAFRRLRAEDPVHWYAPGGFWCITRHADLQHVSRHPGTFSSARGTQVFEIALHRAGTAGPQELAPSIIRMDPPAHNRHRRLVIQAFTPRAVARLEPRVRQLAREHVERIAPGEPVDLVDALAAPVPLLVIAEMLGVPAADRADFRRWSDVMVEVGGGGGLDGRRQAAIAELYAYFRERLAERRRAPADDLLSTLLAARIGGERLTEPEILVFCMTLLVAGNETTRNLISGGTWLLATHPQELRRLRRDPALLPNAVEEMLRWWTPVQTFVRCATRPAELRGRKLDAGDYLVLFYASANRDEAVFGEDSDAFDAGRPSAPRHVAFGFGEHLCLGASLARLEARVVFEELLGRRAGIDLDGPPLRPPSLLMNGIERLPVVLGA